MSKAAIDHQQLENLTRGERIVLVESLLKENGELRARLSALEAELTKPKKPPTTSRNSSQPPSRDQKPDLGEKRSGRRVSAKPGHEPAIRPLVEKPDRVIEAKVEKCANRHADLSRTHPARIIRHQITELPPARTVVIETQIREGGVIAILRRVGEAARPVAELIAGRAESWVSDCLGVQRSAPAENRQLRLAHQIRDLERLIEQYSGLIWAVQMKALFLEAIHLNPEVPPTNNPCEQALRPSVVHRKVTNDFRSEWAAKAYAASETVIDTAKLKGRKAFEAFAELTGIPILPILDASTP